MSTVLATKRATFFRSSSLEKLRCTASLMFPLQLSGFKFSKESQSYFSQNSLTIRTRTHLYRSYLATSNAISEILCTVLVWVLDILAKLSVINESVAAEITYKYKLRQKKLILRKRKQNSNIKNVLSKYDQLVSPLKTVDRNNNQIKDDSDGAQDDEDFQLDKLFDVRAQSVAENRKKFYRTVSTGSLLQRTPSSTSFRSKIIEDRIIINNSLRNNGQRRNSLVLSSFVYGTLVVVYFKLSILCLALYYANLPPGLVFMVTCLIVIGSILVQMFHSRSSKTTLTTTTTTTTITQIQRNSITPEQKIK